MRKKLPMPVLTQANIVFCAYRSVEDKLQAMTWLLSRAEEEEKEDLEQAAAYLRFVGRQITSGKNGGPGRWDRKEIWMARCRYHEYNWIGRFKSHEERAMRYGEEDEDYPYTADSMERCRLDGAFELSAIDWLHPASEEELPKEQKELAKIGRELRAMRKKSSKEAEERFLNIFIDWRTWEKKS